MAESLSKLHKKLADRRASVVVVGLGYVGLPLAVAAAKAGHHVIGIDLSGPKVNAVNAGRSTVNDVPDDDVAVLVSRGALRATSDYSEAASADVAVIAVPTPIDEYRVPDLAAVTGAAKSLAETIGRWSLVILESTTYPGTTEEIVIPALRDAGLEPGVDVLVGYSPERIDPGNATWNITNTPKVVAGLTPESLDLVVEFYSSFVASLVPVSNLRTAEITKLFENIFRIVNVALVNEFQSICDSFGIDVWEVIAACATKPYGYMPFYPGPGLGGHCVPVDPFYLAFKAREKHVNTEFIELAGRINAQKPAEVVAKVARLLNASQRSLSGSRVGLLGVAYKRNTADTRESPAVRILELLNGTGAEVSYHDPHVPEFVASARILKSQPLTEEYLRSQDCLVVVTDHDEIDWQFVAGCGVLVVDTRNVIAATQARLPGSASNGHGRHLEKALMVEKTIV